MSDVKNATQQVCEIIRDSKLKHDVSEVLAQLEATSLPGNNPNGELSYFVRRRHKQFLGYLEGHFRRQELINVQPPLLIQSLSDEQLQVLSTAHVLLQGIVENVLNDAFKNRPGLAAAASPYYGADPSWWATAQSADKSFDEAARGLVKAVAQDAPARIVAQSTAGLPVILPSGLIIQFVKTMNALETDAGTAGVDGAPGRLRETVALSGRTDEAGAMLRSIFGGLCLRAQIRTVLQSLYQEFTSPKLAVLSDKDILDVTYDGTTAIGYGVIVKVQTSPRVLGIGEGDIIFTKDDYFRLDGLAAVDAFRVFFSSETGGVDTLNLRILDDSLEPYSALVDLLLQIQPKP